MKKLSQITLEDILPESALLDPKLKAAAEALSYQLQKVSLATREVLHLPRLDELSGNILDFLAEQLHVDFYEPLYLNETEKRNLIRDSIAWHRIKGTPAAVEMIAKAAFRDAEISEWFDYGGEPYHFKIKSHGYKETPDDWQTYLRMIDVAKNVRSHLDDITIIYEDAVAKAFIGNVELQAGDKTFLLKKPDTEFVNQLYAATADLVHGNKTESFRPRKTNFRTLNFAAQVLLKTGNIRIDTADEPRDEDYFSFSWKAKVFAETADLISGMKIFDMHFPKQIASKSAAGIANLIHGNKRVGINPRSKRATKAYSAQVLIKGGTIEFDTANVPQDESYIARSWKARPFADIVNLKTGDLAIQNHLPRSRKVVVHIGQPLLKTGRIVVGTRNEERGTRNEELGTRN